jgi:hypothetical protein
MEGGDQLHETDHRGRGVDNLPALTARAASELSRDQIVVAMGGHRHIRRRKMSEVSDRRRIDLRQRIGRWGQQRAGDGAGVERRDASW